MPKLQRILSWLPKQPKIQLTDKRIAHQIGCPLPTKLNRTNLKNLNPIDVTNLTPGT